jgi:hypothetical protein
MLNKVKNACVLILFAVCVSLLGFEALTASQEIPSHQHRYGSEATKKDAQSSAAAFSQLHAAEEASKRKEKQEQAAHQLKEFTVEFFNLKLSDVVIAIFTIVLAVKTAGLFRETGGLRESTDKLWRAGEEQIEVARIAAQAAKDSADIAKAAFLSSDRPWLKIVDASVSGPLTFDPTTREGRIEFKLAIKNVGRSPAVNVSMASEAVASITTLPNMQPDPMNLEVCKRLREPLFKWPLGSIVFPDDTIIRGMSIPIPANEIATYKSLLIEKGIKDPKMLVSISPLILGCVDYQLPVDGSHHQTGFAYHVNRRDTANPGGTDFTVDTSVQSTSADEVVLRDWFTGGSYAD